MDTRAGHVLRRDIHGSIRAGDLDAYRDLSLIYADWLDDAGLYPAADRRRRKAARVRSFGCLWPKPRHIEGISEHQRDELAHALVSPLAILAGSPGTGKTYATAAVIKTILESRGGQVAVCAPTGKAAVRITETLARYGVESGRARTIHQTLEIGRNGHDGDGWGFRRNAGNPLETRTVIVDEASMLDTALFNSLMQACAPGTHLLLVGDPNQLPPVGHGSPLRDLIAAGVPCAMLTEIHRNGGKIVEACAAIREGGRLTPHVSIRNPDVLQYTPLNLFNIACEGDDASLRKLEGHIRNWANFAGPADDPSQVLVATNKGKLGRDNVNKLMQEWCNPCGGRIEGNPFRAGDKVICLRNGWYRGMTDDDNDPDAADAYGEVYIANGEMGTILEISRDDCIARFPTARVIIPNGKRRTESEDDQPSAGGGEHFALGYAITVHKSQGSEFPSVVVLLDSSAGARLVCSREWLYTAISRASQSCVLVGDLGVAEMMIRRPSLNKRKTFLREELEDARNARAQATRQRWRDEQRERAEAAEAS